MNRKKLKSELSAAYNIWMQYEGMKTNKSHPLTIDETLGLTIFTQDLINSILKQLCEKSDPQKATILQPYTDRMRRQTNEIYIAVRNYRSLTLGSIDMNTQADLEKVMQNV